MLELYVRTHSVIWVNETLMYCSLIFPNSQLTQLIWLEGYRSLVFHKNKASVNTVFLPTTAVRSRTQRTQASWATSCALPQLRLVWRRGGKWRGRGRDGTSGESTGIRGPSQVLTLCQLWADSTAFAVRLGKRAGMGRWAVWWYLCTLLYMCLVFVVGSIFVWHLVDFFLFCFIFFNVVFIYFFVLLFSKLSSGTMASAFLFN